MEKILIVEDDLTLQKLMAEFLSEEGYNVLTEANGHGAVNRISKETPDLILLDINLPDLNGLEVLRKIKSGATNPVTIIVSGSTGVKIAVKAMKLGAYDYIVKPFDNDELLMVIQKALKTRYLHLEVENLRKQLYENTREDTYFGNSKLIKQVLQEVELVAPTSMSVIIQGKSGTGKEITARLIHSKSLRGGNPFVAIDCGAIPETLFESELFGHEKGSFTGADATKTGKFEAAHQGTLLLDEITNLPLESQAKLLRALEERKIQRVGGKKQIKVDVRIIATTNMDIAKLTRTGKFREDLFHRINEFLINLPELKDRKEDILPLARLFLKEANLDLSRKITDFSDEACRKLLDYQWPGNIRELKNTVKRAVLMTNTDLITPEAFTIRQAGIDFQAGVLDSVIPPLNQAVRKLEENLIRIALNQCNYNKTRTAEILQINRKILYRKMQEYKIPL
ncbi:MAG: sigma-54-dependent Fis family transcriptional regulator [Candidatus Cloacimonetes bacterium]|nr:sigma-54-dependent Fis family transcriptional regulator [Candidatus Cloacimonadota bacterium]